MVRVLTALGQYVLGWSCCDTEGVSAISYNFKSCFSKSN